MPAVIHVHLRDDAAEPTLDLGRLKEAVAALRAETDLIVQLSSGGAVTDPEADRLRGPRRRARHGLLHDGHGQLRRRRVPQPVGVHRRAAHPYAERAIVPEYEIFDLGQLTTLRRLLDRHGLPFGGHVHLDLVMGVPGGMPGTAEALVACVQAMRDLPEGTTFSATGIGRGTLPVMLASLSAGGHLRVGMEDTVTYAKGEPVESNAQLVARAAAFARLAQRPPMTPADARALLGIPCLVRS